MENFSLTYQLVTELSSMEGDSESHGFIEENLTLREALEWLEDNSYQYNLNGLVEADCWPVINPRWFTFYGNQENMCQWQVSLHLPDDLTEATRQRIARFIGCSGLRR